MSPSGNIKISASMSGQITNVKIESDKIGWVLHIYDR